MTAKRDSKGKPKKDERPKLKKEKLKDLTPEGVGVRGCVGGTRTCWMGGRGNQTGCAPPNS